MPAERSAEEESCVKQLHLVLDDGAAEMLAAAVTAAEKRTSAEIMVRLAAVSPAGDMRRIAEGEFVNLGMAELPLENGVLIYISLNRRAVEIVVGEQAASKIPSDVWQRAVDEIVRGFASGKPAEGIITALEEFVPALEQHFPAGAVDAINLPNVTEDP